MKIKLRHSRGSSWIPRRWITFKVSEETFLELDRYAKQKGIPVQTLTAQLLEIMAKENLFDAVLDEVPLQPMLVESEMVEWVNSQLLASRRVRIRRSTFSDHSLRQGSAPLELRPSQQLPNQFRQQLSRNWRPRSGSKCSAGNTFATHSFRMTIMGEMAWSANQSGSTASPASSHY